MDAPLTDVYSGYTPRGSKTYSPITFGGLLPRLHPRGVGGQAPEERVVQLDKDDVIADFADSLPRDDVPALFPAKQPRQLDRRGHDDGEHPTFRNLHVHIYNHAETVPVDEVNDLFFA